ncbi:allantoate amidohydrolase [Vibrio hannami]|uniref:allantoate amidohydrolase n=1 Tax=Vibrio hannami TaxID=2717094 RepID=UPI002410A05B|nr:allantoate amidohydrolase [Vibrio hannami]MDG3085259.1 allantoate amidohydrolase [Vibrio hannami]
MTAKIMDVDLSIDTSKQLAKQVMDYCEQLAEFTQTIGIMDRRYLTPEHRETNDQLTRWAAESGLEHWQDLAGNQWVRLTSANENAKRIILGSHTDTVPNGGKYDGILGVVAPLVLLKWLAELGKQFEFHIDVVGFGDEEGTRFGATLLGSSAIAGKWQSRWRELKDEDGITLAQAMYDFGLDVSKISETQIDSSKVLAYLEAHIEQGPILEEKGLPISAVQGISGARRFEITIEGHAGHAGTVPMILRADPLVVASQWVTDVSRMAAQTSESTHPVVATVGKLEVSPGAVNVIPGGVSLTLDIRSISNDARDSLTETLFGMLEESASENGLVLKVFQTHDASSVVCDAGLTDRLKSIVDDLTGDPTVLVSGAGHDAMAMADIVPTTMMFVRCEGGISHHPDESIQQDDVSVALTALYQFINSQ